MALIPNAMAAQIISSLSGLNQPGGVQIMWQTICSYVQTNAQVMYAWVGVNPASGVPDPVVVANGIINTAPGMTLNLAGMDKLQDASSAMTFLSGAMNTAAATWMIQWLDPTFLLTPCLVIPTITLTPSGMNNQQGAMNMLAIQVIAGIKLATPAASGTHAAFTGAATFTSIL